MTDTQFYGKLGISSTRSTKGSWCMKSRRNSDEARGMKARWVAVLAAAALLQSCGGCGKAADGADTGLVCSANSHPERDSECAGNIGCNKVNQAACGCRCTTCMDNRCVEFLCVPACDAATSGGADASGGTDGGTETGWPVDSDADIGPDGAVQDFGWDTGMDASVDAAADAAVDARIDGSIECKDPGNLEGVYLDRDWDMPVNLIDNSYRAAIGEKHLVWLVPYDGMTGKALRFLDLETKKAMQMPNCQNEWWFNELSVKGTRAVWTNAHTPPNGRVRRVAFLADLSQKDQPRVVSMDEDGSVYDLRFYGNNLVYDFNSRSSNVESYVYHTDMQTGISKKLWPDSENPVYADLFDHTLISGGTRTIQSVDIDTLKKTIHKPDTDERILPTGFYEYKVAYQSWIDSAKYGHPSTDVFVLDIRDDSTVRLTADERSQWAPGIFENLVIWHEVANEKAEEGFGYFVIHDLETGIRRRIPGIETNCGAWGLTKRFAAICDKAGSYNYPLYLVDLEKAGVVKDGHVVPEVGDGGASGQ